jgi:hypothetical protein
LVEALRGIEANPWRQFRSCKSLQDEHRCATAWAMPKRILTGNRGRFRGCTTGKLIQQLTAKGYAGSAETIGKKSEVTDAHERFGYMQEEAA